MGETTAATNFEKALFLLKPKSNKASSIGAWGGGDEVGRLSSNKKVHA